MSITVNGKKHRTIHDAARRFKVAPKTVYGWIENGIIPKPPTVQQGLKSIRIFPDDYMKDAMARIRQHKRQNK
jgi:predicted site-specific integrase-resolvase